MQHVRLPDPERDPDLVQYSRGLDARGVIVATAVITVIGSGACLLVALIFMLVTR